MKRYKTRATSVFEDSSQTLFKYAYKQKMYTCLKTWILE